MVCHTLHPQSVKKDTKVAHDATPDIRCVHGCCATNRCLGQQCLPFRLKYCLGGSIATELAAVANERGLQSHWVVGATGSQDLASVRVIAPVCQHHDCASAFSASRESIGITCPALHERGRADRRRPGRHMRNEPETIGCWVDT
eukprot:4302941-Amphidinium_carterae.1